MFLSKRFHKIKKHPIILAVHTFAKSRKLVLNLNPPTCTRLRFNTNFLEYGSSDERVCRIESLPPCGICPRLRGGIMTSYTGDKGLFAGWFSLYDAPLSVVWHSFGWYNSLKGTLCCLIPIAQCPYWYGVSPKNGIFVYCRRWWRLLYTLLMWAPNCCSKTGEHVLNQLNSCFTMMQKTRMLLY